LLTAYRNFPSVVSPRAIKPTAKVVENVEEKEPLAPAVNVVSVLADPFESMVL
jgi:hypothetical protein